MICCCWWWWCWIWLRNLGGKVPGWQGPRVMEGPHSEVRLIYPSLGPRSLLLKLRHFGQQQKFRTRRPDQLTKYVQLMLSALLPVLVGKYGNRDASSTADVWNCHRHAPDQMMLQTCPRWCHSHAPHDAPDMSQMMSSSGPLVVPKWSSSGPQERLLFKNIAHDGSFQHCTWLYLANKYTHHRYIIHIG